MLLAMTNIEIQTIKIHGIPVLTFSEADARALPLVFFIHGFTGSKEDGLETGYRMAQSGLFCAAIDAHLHGERLGAPLDDLNSPKRVYLYPQGTGFDTYFVMLECALQTSRDLDLLIDHFASDPRVDAARAGVTGFSMGGFAAYFAAAESPRIQAAVPAGAYPDLSYRWQNLVLEATAYPEWTAAMDALRDENERRAAWLAEINPAPKLLHAFHKPLLMQAGDQDLDSPKAFSIPFFGAMRLLYADQPDRLRLHILDNVGHQLTREMIDETVGWFKNCL
jgi:uncharacterized protein